MRTISLSIALLLAAGLLTSCSKNAVPYYPQSRCADADEQVWVQELHKAWQRTYEWPDWDNFDDAPPEVQEARQEWLEAAAMLDCIERRDHPPVQEFLKDVAALPGTLLLLVAFTLFGAPGH